MVTGVHCSWKYSISMCYMLFSCLTCHPPVLFLSLINRGFAALQSWKPLRLKVWGCFSFLLKESGWPRLPCAHSRCSPSGWPQERGGLQAMLFPRLTPTWSCPRAPWPPPSVMVTGELCCCCRLLRRPLESPGWDCPSFAAPCSFVVTAALFLCPPVCRWKRKGKGKGLGFKTTQR